MSQVTSKDGTAIAFDKVGAGQPVILVDGAICYRAFGPMQGLAALLAPHFSVYTYDRRGRGESGDTAPYAVEREVEDIEALIDEVGGSAFVLGLSSGAALAMEAAARLGDKIKKLAMYEAPYNDDAAARQTFRQYRQELSTALESGRRGDAVEHFMSLVGTPPDQIGGMRQSPVWPTFEAIAPTLAYDAAVLGDEAAVRTDRASRVTVPALVMDGGAGLPFMHPTAVALANAMPKGQQRTLAGQTHEVAMDVLAPVAVEFFAG